MSANFENLDTRPGADVDDLSALSWVNGELRKSLDVAHKALRRYVKEAEANAGSDVAAVDPSVLRTARAQIHQGVGALVMVGLPQAATVLRASEAAVQRLMARPSMLDAGAVETLEKSSFALLDFLARQLARKETSPVMLFPQYRAVQTLAAAERIHPADLWPHEWQWHDLPADPRATPRAANDTTRGLMETQALTLMRQLPVDAAERGRAAAADGNRDALMQMSDLCADLGAGALESSFGGPHVATFWRLAAAVFEAEANGLLAPDMYAKRLASGMLTQLRQRIRGQGEVSERQAQDLLFFCAHAKPPALSQDSPRLAAVRTTWKLDAWPTADYETVRLGRHDPAMLALARKRVATAKDSWSAVAGGELHRIGGLNDQFLLMGESVTRLFPAGDVLARSMHTAITQTVERGAEPAPALAMEVATAMLYVDASLEDAQFDHPELAERVQRLARRIDEVRIGAEPQPLDTWMEELYRRVSDRQTMGSVVQELRASLSEIEKQIDQYFRNPARREVLIPVPAQLSAMRGVLSVLGMSQASQAALHMRDDVEALAQTEVDPQMAIRAGTFDRLADNLGALSFLIDMLSVQPQLAKSLFRFDPETGSLSAVMGQRERVSAFAAFDDGPAATAPAPRATMPRATPALVPHSPLAPPATVSAQPPSAALAASAASPIAPFAAVASAPAADTGLEDDAEMREIFIEEAREVIADARAAVERLIDVPDGSGDLTIVRRAFHTLKGSSRMLGLNQFGEAGWACEQLYNDRIASAPRMDSALRGFTTEALDYLAGWADAIEHGESRGHRAVDVARAADSLRLRGERLPIPAPATGIEAPALRPEPDVAAVPVVPVVAAANEDALLLSPAAAPDLMALEFDLQEDPAPTLAELPDLPDLPALPDLTELPEHPELAEPTLQARVPGLPNASDLDLGAAPAAASPSAPARVEEPLFALDLDALEDSADAYPTLELPRLELPSLDLPTLDLSPREAVPGVLAEPFGSDATDLPLDLELPLAAALSPAQPAAVPEGQALDIAPGEFDDIFGDVTQALPQPLAADVPAAAATADALGIEAGEAIDADEEPVKQIGPLRIGIPLFNIYLNEADELSRLLGTELSEWSLEWERHPVPASSVARAHSLAGSSATVGYSELSGLARALEHALMRSHAHGRGRPFEAGLFNDVADEIRRLLHQFAAGFLRSVAPELTERLADHERWPVETAYSPEAFYGVGADDQDDKDVDQPEPQPVSEADLPVQSAPAVQPEPAGAPALLLPEPPALHEVVEQPALASPASVEAAADAAAVDAIDSDLFPIFEEEADELLPQLQTRLREWVQHPDDADASTACMRTLHTLKGGARLSGAMRIGEMAHALETAIEALAGRGHAAAADIEPLLGQADAMSVAFDALREGQAAGHAAPVRQPAKAEPITVAVTAAPMIAPPAMPEPAAEPVLEPVLEPRFGPLPEPAAATPAPPRRAIERASAVAQRTHPMVSPTVVDWAQFSDPVDEVAAQAPERAGAGMAVVRVRAGLLDRMVNQAGEVSITRARIDADVRQMQNSLGDLTDSMERMRRQLRDIEVQAETQITTRIEAAKAAAQEFDPLEMDRFTRFQELTRFMAESVNDVATLQRSLQRTLQSTEDELAAQARLTRELQDDLLRTRMIEFDSISERLFRTARQAAKETGKQVKVEIVGGAIEIDRGVLERMAGPFEHLLRNCVAHGIEKPEGRAAAKKEATGTITITVAQAGNEVAVEFGDDGSGLNLARIRQRGIERGLIAADAAPGESELAALIFAPGFSTAESVTELAGRGVGLDVVRAEVNAMGGRIETASEAGKGTRFKLLLPLTTAVTQVVMLRAGDLKVAVPSPLIEIVQRTPSDAVLRAYESGVLEYAGEKLPFYWLPALLRSGSRGDTGGRTQAVAIVRSAAQRVAVHVDEVLGNQEVVVKNVGPQLARLPGLAGVTLLPSGAVALIYNPVALSALYGDEARERQRPSAAGGAVAAVEAAAPRAPLVMVVDDSLTVRRVTQRLLLREGYRVVLAKDGLDALEKLGEERPTVLLSDIEMPRMDGFDLVRNLRADAALAQLPVVMITSRIAQKHREYAAELGVQHYLGKPYSEEELLALVARYARPEALH